MVVFKHAPKFFAPTHSEEQSFIPLPASVAGATALTPMMGCREVTAGDEAVGGVAAAPRPLSHLFTLGKPGDVA